MNLQMVVFSIVMLVFGGVYPLKLEKIQYGRCEVHPERPGQVAAGWTKMQGWPPVDDSDDFSM